ncbi:hypothetical protein IGI04_042630, partial [Brassica rapa subsp. trilocularis]
MNSRSGALSVWCVISSLLVCNIQRPRALERCVISDLSLGVSRSLSAASCVTIRSTYLEKLESFDSFLQGLSHLFQSIILGSHQVVSEQLWKGSVLISFCSRFDLFIFSSSTMAGDQKGEFTKEEKLLIEAMTNHLNQTMGKMMKAKMEELRQEVRQERPRATGQNHESRRSERRQRREHEGRGSHKHKFADQKLKIPPFHGNADPAAYVEWEEKMELIFDYQSYAEVKKVQLTTAEFCGYASSWWKQLVSSRRHYGKEPVATWLKLRALMRHKYVPRQYHKEVLRKQSEAKPCSANSVQEQQGRIRSRSTGVISLPSKTTSWFCEEDIKKLSQVIMDVEKQFRETHTTRPSLEEQNQELITSVSELNSAEPVSATSIQGDQAKESSAAIQKDEQPVQNVMVPFKQAIVPEETPREPQTACKKRQLIVFDPCDFQKTFLGIFLFNPFVWNKTRAVELSRHELGMEHVVFEPGGELWNHRNNPLVIEKKSAATTIVFGDLLPSEAKGMHVSAQQEFHYETNWRMLPTLSWIQQTGKHSKWPPDHQDIVNSAKHIGLVKFCELLISDWTGRLQIYLWKPGAYDSTLIILGECSARARTSLGNKELEADQNALLLDHVKVWKPPDLQKLQYHFRDCQIKSGDGDFIRVNSEVITGVGGKLMFSSQNKEKPPDGLSQHQSPNKSARGNYLDSKKRMKPDLLSIGTGQTVLSARIFEKRGYSNDQSIQNGYLAKLEMQQPNLGSCLATNFDIGAVRGSYLSNQKELSNKLNCNGNYTHQGLTSNWNHDQSFSNERVMDSTRRVILCLLCLNFSEFRTSQSYLWRPGEHAKVTNHVFKSSFIYYTDMMHLFLPKESCADYMEALKHAKRKNKREEDKRLSNASGVRKAKWISPFYLIEPVSDNADQRGLQGNTDLRTNLFEVGGDDVIMESTKAGSMNLNLKSFLSLVFRLPREPAPFNEFEKWSLNLLSKPFGSFLSCRDLLVCNIQRPRALERCVISDLSLGVSRSLSAASCVTIRSTYLEKLESFD